MKGTISYNLSKEEINVISHCIREDIDFAKKLLQKGSRLHKLLVVPAVSAPKGVSSRIEILIRPSVTEKDAIHIYNHLCVSEENGYSVSILLYPKHLDGNMLKNMNPSTTVPYEFIFKEE